MRRYRQILEPETELGLPMKVTLFSFKGRATESLPENISRISFLRGVVIKELVNWQWKGQIPTKSGKPLEKLHFIEGT